MQKIRSYIAVTIIVLITIIIYPLTDNGGLYLPLIYFMYLSPALIVFLCFNKFTKEELFLWGIIPMLFLSSIFVPDRFRQSTVIYSTLFILIFILFKRLLQSKAISLLQYKKTIKYIITAYFLVLVAQQIGYIFNLPIININFVEKGFKLNSLSYEASYVAALLPLLMLSVVKTDEIIFNRTFDIFSHIKTESRLWLMFLYTIFTCGASTVFFTFPIFILYFFKRKLSLNQIAGIILVLSVGIYLINVFNPVLLDRQAQLVPAILSLDSRKIIETDRSASTRIIPLMELFNKLSSIDAALIFGYGVDYSKQQFSKIIVEDSEREIGAGGIVAFIIDYGLITGILFIISVIKFTSNKLFSYENLFYFSCFFIFSFNNYLTWSYFIFMFANKYFANAGSVKSRKTARR